MIAAYPDKKITYENINDAPILKAVLMESQRMHPAVNMLFRICEKDCEISGFQFKVGDAVGVDVYSMHNSEDYWTEPEKFKPERFMTKDFKIENDDSNVFLPFGSGPRACVAARMAFVEAAATLGQIILNYEVYRSSKTSVPPKVGLHDATCITLLKRESFVLTIIFILFLSLSPVSSYSATIELQRDGDGLQKER